MFEDFLFQRYAVFKYPKVYADGRIKAEMKSLSFLCVVGRGQPRLAGGSGGVWSRKSQQLKKGGPLTMYSFYKILYISQ